MILAYRRRILLSTAMLVLAPRLPFAQTSAKVPRIGYLVTGGSVSFPLSVEPFRRGMRELGYVEGKDYVMELRTAEGRSERLPLLASELAGLNVDIIVTSSTPATQAAMRATTTIPIVVANSTDPVASGLVRSLARPGGNVTGLSNIAAELGQKQLEILQTALPGLSRVGLLVHPDSTITKLVANNIVDAAKSVGINIVRIEARNAAEIEVGFTTLTRERAPGLIVALEPFFIQQRRQLAELALKSQIATMFGGSGHVEAGGLFSYGPDISDNFRRAAGYVDRILRGGKAGDLPIEQPAKFEFLINLKTAKSLRLTIPQELRFRANRVFE